MGIAMQGFCKSSTRYIATQVLGIVMLHKVIEVYVMYKQGTTGFEYDTRFVGQE